MVDALGSRRIQEGEVFAGEHVNRGGIIKTHRDGVARGRETGGERLFPARRLAFAEQFEVCIIEANITVKTRADQASRAVELDPIAATTIVRIPIDFDPIAAAIDADATCSQRRRQIASVRGIGKVRNDVWQTRDPPLQPPAVPVEEVDVHLIYCRAY